MKKYILDMMVNSNCRIHKNYCLLKLGTIDVLPEMLPGQFVEVKVDHSPSTFLRRPISINFVDRDTNELWLLIQIVGDGTKQMAEYKPGDIINVELPLGNSFSIPGNRNDSLLLIGGGVGVAPMLYLGAFLRKQGFNPTFLLGARSQEDVLQSDLFHQYGEVYITTENGSLGEKGFVTDHTIFQNSFDFIYACGPKPMMMAVAKSAFQRNIVCEVSLENKMACGIGACLCCIEKTTEGNVCVCSEGPVFNIKKLKWQN